MAIADTLSFLLGVWDVERLVEDRRSPAPVSFQGRATVEPVEPGTLRAIGRRAHYAERGKIQVGAHSGPASRQLEMVSVHHLAVMIYFIDGRPFLDLDLATGNWLSSHVCVDDHY